MILNDSMWASDTPISMPVPPDDPNLPILLDFGGIGFTAGGPSHSITETEREEMFSPFFAPDDVVPTRGELLMDTDET